MTLWLDDVFGSGVMYGKSLSERTNRSRSIVVTELGMCRRRSSVRTVIVPPAVACRLLTPRPNDVSLMTANALRPAVSDAAFQIPPRTGRRPLIVAWSG